MFFINNNKKSSEQSKAYYTLPAIFIRSRLKLLTFFTFSTVKKGEIKIQTKHKYIYRTNTKAKLAFSCNIFRLFALLLTKTCLRDVIGMFVTVIICLMLIMFMACSTPFVQGSEFPDGSHQP